MIPYEIRIELDDFFEIKDILASLALTARGPSKRRYISSHMLWTTAKAHNPCHVLDLRDWDEELLWDLWGVIPFGHQTIRDVLVRFLERSPLIKLAECAE